MNRADNEETMTTTEDRESLPYSVRLALRVMGLDKARLVAANSERTIEIRVDDYQPHWSANLIEAKFHNLYSAIDVTTAPDGKTFPCYEAFRVSRQTGKPCPNCARWMDDSYGWRTNAFSMDQYAMISRPNVFAIRQAGIAFDPAGDEPEMRMFASSYRFRLRIGDCYYYDSPIAASFRFSAPQTAGLKGPVEAFTELQDVPLILPADIPYAVELEGTRIGLKPFMLWVMLCGIMFRAPR